MGFRRIIKETLSIFEEILHSRVTESLDWEVQELQNIFTILVFAQWVGLPSPPLPVSLAILPYMEEELIHLLQSSVLSDDALSLLFSQLSVT